MQRQQQDHQDDFSEESYPSWQEYFPRQPHNQPNHLFLINQTIFSDLGIPVPSQNLVQTPKHSQNHSDEEPEDNEESLQYRQDSSSYQMGQQPSIYQLTPPEDIDEDLDLYEDYYSQLHSHLLEQSQQSSFSFIHDSSILGQQRIVGMSQEQIATLPTVHWTSSNLNEQCSICMETFQKGEVLRVMPCLHRNHISCIDPWLLSKASCPSCRAATK